MQNGSCGPREMQSPYKPTSHKGHGIIAVSSSPVAATATALSPVGGVPIGANGTTNGSVTVRKMLTHGVWLN